MTRTGPMRALITGAGGQLGRALASRVPTGWEAVALSRAKFDLADPLACARQVRELAPDLVLNAAAYTAVDGAESDEAAAHLVNADAPGALAHAARNVGAHFVHVSTDFVFDGTRGVPYRPDDARAPLGVYGRTKAAGEDAAGPDSTVVRTAWVYPAEGGNFVHTMLRLMATRDEVRVVADQIGSPTWASSLTQVLWALGATRRAGIWHYTDAGVASWYDFAVAIQEEALARGLLERAVPVIPIPTADYPTPARRPPFSVLDSSRTREALGIPAVHWRVNLRAMLSELAGARGKSFE